MGGLSGWDRGNNYRSAGCVKIEGMSNTNPNPTLPQPPLSQPLYGASFGQAVTRFFKKYARFSGYASRSEYWWAQLAQFIYYFAVFGVAFALMSHDSDYVVLSAMDIALLAQIVVLIPQIAVGVRRLHDAGFHGSWYLINLIPFIGGIIYLVLVLLPTAPDKHRPEWDDKTGD